MRVRLVVPFLIAAGCLLNRVLAADQIDQIREYFRELDVVCQKDDGALWGTALCGPVLLVNPTTRDVFANQSDRKNRLQKRETIFTGTLPAFIFNATATT